MSDAAAHATITLAQSSAMLNGERAKGNFNTDEKIAEQAPASRTCDGLRGANAGEPEHGRGGPCHAGRMTAGNASASSVRGAVPAVMRPA